MNTSRFWSVSASVAVVPLGVQGFDKFDDQHDTLDTNHDSKNTQELDETS
ncbi:MAG: hypothetical protein GVY17_08110 [Cyanobacteria bacterium]|nr:hypothetical protein [Cyanobacteria bacterium GSL.Bin21]